MQKVILFLLSPSPKLEESEVESEESEESQEPERTDEQDVLSFRHSSLEHEALMEEGDLGLGSEGQGYQSGYRRLDKGPMDGMDASQKTEESTL